MDRSYIEVPWTDVIGDRTEEKTSRGKRKMGMLDGLKDRRPYLKMKRRAGAKID